MKWVIITVMTILTIKIFSARKEEIIDVVNNYSQDVLYASEVSGMPANIIKAVMYVESAGNPYAVSDAGAVGLMQVTDIAAQDIGYTMAPTNPKDNIVCGSKYLKKMIDRMGTLYDGLRAYNCGPTGATENALCGSHYASKVISLIPDFT